MFHLSMKNSATSFERGSDDPAILASAFCLLKRENSPREVSPNPPSLE
ncbi:hypothetical protein T08_10407, partial [Trichinella sp. T8]